MVGQGSEVVGCGRHAVEADEVERGDGVGWGGWVGWVEMVRVQWDGVNQPLPTEAHKTQMLRWGRPRYICRCSKLS